MIISVEFKNGLAEVNVVSAEDSELKELPHFAQALLSTKLDSDGITKIFELLKSFTEDVLGKDDAEDNGYITDNNKNFLKEFNNEKFYDSNVNFADKVNKPKNISTSNKKAPVSVTLEKLYKEYDAAKAEYSEYRTLHNILLDIAGEPDISDTDIEILNAKIKMCKMKRDAVGSAYKALFAFIESIGGNYSCVNIGKTVKQLDITNDGDFDGDTTIDNGKPSKIKAIKTGLKHGNNYAYYKNDIDAKNIIDTDTQAVLENKHSIVDIIISLYKKCETAKRRFKKYSQMMSILKDIRDDEYISDNDRVLIDDKIKSCEEKISGLKAAYEKLMKAISEV